MDICLRRVSKVFMFTIISSVVSLEVGSLSLRISNLGKYIYFYTLFYLDINSFLSFILLVKNNLYGFIRSFTSISPNLLPSQVKFRLRCILVFLLLHTILAFFFSYQTLHFLYFHVFLSYLLCPVSFIFSLFSMTMYEINLVWLYGNVEKLYKENSHSWKFLDYSFFNSFLGTKYLLRSMMHIRKIHSVLSESSRRYKMTISIIGYSFLESTLYIDLF